jgi:hypothetical protein
MPLFGDEATNQQKYLVSQIIITVELRLRVTIYHTHDSCDTVQQGCDDVADERAHNLIN